MAGRVYHWKHGWIPLDGYARQVKEGKLTAAHPGAVPQRVLPDRKDQAVDAALEMQTLVPGLGLVHPELVKKNSWIPNEHHSGALKLTPQQADHLIQHLDRIAEYPATPHQARLAVGKQGLQGASNLTRGRDRARLISGAVKGKPDIFPDSGNGGVDIPAYSVPHVLAHLRSGAAPSALYDRQSRVATGQTPGWTPPRTRIKPGALGVPTAARPKVLAYSKMSPADKISAAATMYGTGSKQHRAAQKKFGK